MKTKKTNIEDVTQFILADNDSTAEDDAHQRQIQTDTQHTERSAAPNPIRSKSMTIGVWAKGPQEK